MPLDSNELGTPHDWLRRSRSNLIRAKQPKPEEVLPGPFEPVTEEEFNRALKIAETVVAWAESQIEK